MFAQGEWFPVATDVSYHHLPLFNLACFFNSMAVVYLLSLIFKWGKNESKGNVQN